MTIEKAIEKARDESKNGYIQHVNRTSTKGVYYLSDWFDSDVTVASFEGGRCFSYIIEVSKYIGD